MLNEKTIGFIQQVLEMDNDVTETEKEQVLKAYRMKSARKTIPGKRPWKSYRSADRHCGNT